MLPGDLVCSAQSCSAQSCSSAKCSAVDAVVGTLWPSVSQCCLSFPTSTCLAPNRYLSELIVATLYCIGFHASDTWTCTDSSYLSETHLICGCTQWLSGNRLCQASIPAIMNTRLGATGWYRDMSFLSKSFGSGHSAMNAFGCQSDWGSCLKPMDAVIDPCQEAVINTSCTLTWLLNTGQGCTCMQVTLSLFKLPRTHCCCRRGSSCGS